MLLERRFNFVADPCVFCKSAVESLEHLIFSCQYSQSFWTDIGHWINLKHKILLFNADAILFYVDNLNPAFSDSINIIVLLAKISEEEVSPLFPVL